MRERGTPKIRERVRGLCKASRIIGVKSMITEIITLDIIIKVKFFMIKYIIFKVTKINKITF